MKVILTILLSFVLLTSVVAAEDEAVEVTLRSDKETILNKANLIRVKLFILMNGERRTYCTMYCNNPFYETEHYKFYLNPDPGGSDNHPQFNMNCDTKKGDFNTLVIRRKLAGKYTESEVHDQYRAVNFLAQYTVTLIVDYPTPSMQVSEIREFPEQAIKEILAVIEQTEH